MLWFEFEFTIPFAPPGLHEDSLLLRTNVLIGWQTFRVDFARDASTIVAGGKLIIALTHTH